jgi:hypothetical protein
MNEGINLLDQNKKSSGVILPGHLQKMRILVIGLLFIVSVSSVILFILVELSPLPALQTQEKSLEQTLLSSKSDIVKLSLVKERTTSISTLLAKRQNLDEKLGLVQDKISGNTTVTSLQADNTGILLTAESGSLQDLDNFLNGLIQYVQEKKIFSQVILVDLATDQTNGEYAVSVHLIPL